MNTKIWALAAVLAAPFITLDAAEASERYCREYTRTITVGGVRQSGYGTACYQPDGSWEIVNVNGYNEVQNAVRDYIYDDIYRKDSRVVIIDRTRPVAYYQPRYYYPPQRVVYYKPWPHGHYKKHHQRWHDDRRGRHHGHGHHGHR